MRLLPSPFSRIALSAIQQRFPDFRFSVSRPPLVPIKNFNSNNSFPNASPNISFHSDLVRIKHRSHDCQISNRSIDIVPRKSLRHHTRDETRTRPLVSPRASSCGSILHDAIRKRITIPCKRTNDRYVWTVASVRSSANASRRCEFEPREFFQPV